MSDNWMNPPPEQWMLKMEEPRHKFRIERERSVITFGTGGVTEWHTWSVHLTAEERDGALVKLREEHPMWSLRSADDDKLLHRQIYGRTA